MTDLSGIIAIDPGPEESAFCYELGGALFADKVPNEQLLARLQAFRSWHLAIEMIASYGMPVGESVFETCVWIGRFIQLHGGSYRKIYRKDVKMHLCGSMRAKDSNVRQRLLDLYGKPLTKGFSGDMWAALGVLTTAGDTQGPA